MDAEEVDFGTLDRFRFDPQGNRHAGDERYKLFRCRSTYADMPLLAPTR